MKNGTTSFGFPPRNERSRTDVPRGTGELSHGPDGRSMADSLPAASETLGPGCPPDGLPARYPQRDLLRAAQRLCVADAPARFPEVEDGLRGIPPVAQRWDLAEDPRLSPRQGPNPSRTQDLSQRCCRGQSDGQNNGGRGRARLRCGQENQWAQAAHRRRYHGIDLGGDGPCGEPPRPRRSLAGVGGCAWASIAVSPSQGDLRRQCIRSKRPASSGEGLLQVGPSNRTSTCGVERIRGLAQALDCGANLWLVGPVPSP